MTAVVDDGAWVLSTTDPAVGGAPTFVGNGYLAARIPAAGSGYTTAPVETQSQIAGFYAHPPGPYERRAGVPTWSSLGFSDGSATFGDLPGTNTPAGRLVNYRQSLDLRSGVLTTTLTWRSPAGRVTDLGYAVLADQARAHVAAVQLTITPHWTGPATIIDALDGRAAHLTTTTAATSRASTDELIDTVTAVGTHATATEVSRLQMPGPPRPADHVSETPILLAQRASLAVVRDHTYVVTKYVGIASSVDTDRTGASNPAAFARAEAERAATSGWAALVRETTSAWAALWQSNITVTGNRALTLEARAALFYLLESTRAGVEWSLSPAGLSSDGYSGHVFWDAETWMYPPLLAMHPDIAVGVDTYRQARLGAAQAYATVSGARGARFPWESARAGNEEAPPPWGTNEQHITSDVALAQWQYYEASGDRHWLASKGWPVIRAAADYWVSRATRDPRGGDAIDHVMPPDEEHVDVDNSAYTNASAAITLRIATTAAGLVGAPVDPQWARVADALRVPFDPATGVHPEFDGYSGDTIKQADVVMLQYPWQYPMPSRVANADLAYYAPRVDPVFGPSMTDAIHSIDSAALGDACASWTYLERSSTPFERGPFDQFAETRHGGTFTFLTGMGGFVQEFVYGFTGVRWNADALVLAPLLPPQMRGLTLTGLSWQGRHFDVAIGPRTTTVTLTSGPAMPVLLDGGRRTTARPGVGLVVATRRPDTAGCAAPKP